MRRAEVRRRVFAQLPTPRARRLQATSNSAFLVRPRGDPAVMLRIDQVVSERLADTTIDVEERTSP
jgi:hypothetical protein